MGSRLSLHAFLFVSSTKQELEANAPFSKELQNSLFEV